MSAPRHRAGRRGSNAIEFALILPVFLALISVVFEYGYYFFMRSVVSRSVREGCRNGAVVPPNSTPGPEDTAQDDISSNMGGYNFFGADCDSADDANCDITVGTSGSSPNELLTCTMTMSYGGITGAIPVPDAISFTSFALLEVQR